MARDLLSLFTEIIFRTAASEALLANDERQAGEQCLATALREIELRSALLPDELARRRFFERYENRRALELAAASGRKPGAGVA